MQGADDSARDRLLEPERASDRDDRVADLEVSGDSERNRDSCESGASTLITARSVELSVPTTCAS